MLTEIFSINIFKKNPATHIEYIKDLRFLQHCKLYAVNELTNEQIKNYAIHVT